MDKEEEFKRVSHLPFRLPNNLTDLLDGFKRAVHEKNTSVVMIVDGRSGMGKTTLAGQCGKYLDPNIDLTKCHWENETFLNGKNEEGYIKKGLQQSKKGDCIIYDEAMLISNRAAMSKLNKTIIQAMSMIRSKNIFVIFCVNSIFDLDKNLALSRADILLHVYGKSLTDRGRFMAFFKGRSGKDNLKLLYLLGKKFYDYGKPRSNFNVRFPKHFIFDEEEYERQKQKGIKSFLIGEVKEKENKLRKHFIILAKKLIEEGYSRNKLDEYSDFGHGTISKMLLRQEYIDSHPK